VQHKFFEKWKSGSAAMLPKLEKAREIRASMALQVQTLTPAASEDQVWQKLLPSHAHLRSLFHLPSLHCKTIKKVISM